MMKTSFTNHLKLKWHRVIPLLMMAIMVLPSAWGACDPDPAKITASLDCEGTLVFTIPDDRVVKVEIEAFSSTDPMSKTGFSDMTSIGSDSWELDHATGPLLSGSQFWLKVWCDISDDKGGFVIYRGILPGWDLKNGLGAGDYTFTPSTGLEIGTPGDPTNVPTCGNLRPVLVDVTAPWCPMGDDGTVTIRIDGDNIVEKCEQSMYDVTVNGVTLSAPIGGTVTFTGLSATTYTAVLTEGMGTCPGKVIIAPGTLTFTVPPRRGATTSMACIDNINVSISASCKVTIGIHDVLLGINDPCLAIAMADSIAITTPGGILVGASGSSFTAMMDAAAALAPGASMASILPAVDIDDASEYLGQELTVEIFDRESGNSCWGSALIEDKSPPLITCDRDIPMAIRCLEYDGSVIGTLEGLADDCSQPVTISATVIDVIEDCDDIDDGVLRRIITTYTATDGSPRRNQSEVCVDTIDVLRFDPIPGNNMLDLPGDLIFPCDYILDPDPADVDEKDPFTCTGDFESIIVDGRRIPAPTAHRANNRGGSGFPQLRWMDSKGVTRVNDLLPSNYQEADEDYQRIVQENSINCNIAVRFEDQTFQFGCKTKVLRSWYIREWSCDNDPELFLGTQEIVITDFEAPEITDEVADKILSVSAYDCARYLEIEIPGYEDNCADFEDLIVQTAIYDENWDLIGPLVDPVTREQEDNFNFPLGLSYVVYRISDPCDNFVLDTASVTIIDETPPVVICKEFLVVGLSSDGTVRVPAHAFDNGTYDDCGLERTCVVRMDDLELLQGLDTDRDGEVLFDEFNKLTIACGRDYSEYAYQKEGTGPYYINDDVICTPYVAFCCEDNATTADGADAEDIMVNFRAYDFNGNVNTCMVFVDLQDKQEPEITCLPDITIDCNFELPDIVDTTYANIADDPLSQYFGTIVPQGEQQTFGIPDEFIIEPDDRSGLVDGVFFDNCQTPRIQVEVEAEFDNCGFGDIVRRIQAFDGSGGSNVCIQRIRVRRTIFDDATIIYPNDTTLVGCAIPEDLVNQSFGEPEVVGDKCSLIGISEENQIFTFNTGDLSDDACFKIIRTWTIIDWCQSTNDGQPEIIDVHQQIIKVNDPDGPELTCAPDVREESTDCFAANVMLMATADDECTTGDDLLWSARIEADIDNDGTVETFIELEDADIEQDDSGKAVYNFAEVPVGQHRIIWTVTDRCGNTESCQQNFEVINIKKPTPFAINVSTALMNTNGEVEIWAEDFDQKSVHPCYPDEELSFAISYQGEGFAAATPNMTFTCADSIINYLDFYVFLEVDGQVLFDYTTVQLRVVDNNDFCAGDRGAVNGSEVSAIIAGNIATESAIDLPNVVVDLMTSGNQGASALEEVTTDDGGMYAFPAMPNGGEYMINPVSGDDYLNGVSTLDLVMIQRYVLGLLDFESPYKLIASDINGDDEVSALDLVELRKSILGYQENFPGNTSWKFIDAAYEFANAQRPWDEDYKQSYAIESLEGSMEVNFIGVKVGDVNESVDASSVIAKTRSNHILSATEASFTSAELISMDVTSARSINTVGTQFTIDFDNEALSFVGVEGKSIDISPEHIGMTNVNDGVVSVSWSNPRGSQIEADEVMFTLLFEARRVGNLSSTVDITSTETTAEIYNNNLEVFDLGLTFESEIGGAFTLLQNAPNPFAEETTIQFILPEAGEATLTVHDVTGKRVFIQTGSFDKGNNSISINTSDLETTGVMYYTLQSDEFTDTRRMVVLK